MFLPLGLPCLYLLIFHPIAVVASSCSDASTRCGGSSIDITWPFTTDPDSKCRGTYLIHCNGSTPIFLFNVTGHSYIVENITGNVLTVQDPDLSKIMEGYHCNFLYEFLEPYPRLDAQFIQYLASGSTLFNCNPREYNFSHDIFDAVNKVTPCKGYNLHYRAENQSIDSILPEGCRASSSSLFEWKWSFGEGNDGLSLRGAGFSNQLKLQDDCFPCNIVSGHCTNDAVVGDDGCRCSNICSAAHNGTQTNMVKTKKMINIKIMIGIVSLAVIILCSLLLLTWMRFRHRSTKFFAKKTTLPFGIGRVINLRESEQALTSPLYPLSSIIRATNNFSHVNKLGEGGFGSVYKGILIDGHEIAVKRLATKSGQGPKEFENEIILIAKLQHRNLVRLLGYCIHGEEKILIYEYMPNKSLDKFLYDTTRRAQLDWSRRLHIIEGISQGLLYLHKHSRLKIIHRDLKPSNILLDADMNPKISDFGLARIFDMNETEANTRRIVGTYGYMSPEYAAEGLFSVKSDVFSFGVLLLEIVSGSKNACYHRDGNTLNLLGYAWELWKEENLLELFDPSFDEHCPKHEISRCIHIALLCVQENAIDRPNMSVVIAMLSSDSAIVDPKQPAFFNVRNPVEEEFHSINEATMTSINGR